MVIEQRDLDKLLYRFDRLKSERNLFENHWRELARYCHPTNYFYGQEAGRQSTRRQLYDSTAALSAEALASALFALLTNPSMDWFEFEVDPSWPDGEKLGDAIKAVLEDRSNGLYGVLPDLYRDLVTFGTAILCVEAGRDQPGSVRFSLRRLDEMLFACNEAGQITTAFREFELTAEQCVERFGEKAPKIAQKNALSGDVDRRVRLVHVVVPNPGVVTGALGQKGMAYQSLILDLAGRQIIHVGGYHEFPYLVTRWSMAVGTSQVYGQSPASLALADIRALNAMVRTNLIAAQKAVDPPLMTVDDNGLRGVKTHPGAIVHGGLDIDGKRKVEPLPMGSVGAVNLGLALEEQRRDSIRTAFHIGLLQEAHLQPVQTATEFLGRQEERLRLLAPNLGRLEAELLNPLVKRVAAILQRARVVPPMPLDARVRFLSPLAQAQRAAEAHRLARSIKALQPFIDTIPGVMEHLDTATLTKDLLDFAGLPRLEGGSR